jgi:hypothetical protein
MKFFLILESSCLAESIMFDVISEGALSIVKSTLMFSLFEMFAQLRRFGTVPVEFHGQLL